MLPVLEARRALQRINEMALAFGSMSEQSAEQYKFNLQVQATISFDDDPLPRRAIRPSSPAELAMLSGGSTQVFS